MGGRALSETIILHIARNGLPIAFGAILLASAVAIVLSTGNTFLLVPSTNVSRDLYERFVNPDASEQKKLNVQRLFVVLFGALGILLLTQFDSVLAMALYAYSLVGASLTPVLLAAFLWKRVTPQGGVACISGGLLTIVGLVVADRVGADFSAEIAGTTFDFASSDYVVMPAVIVSVTLLVVVSLLTKPSPESKWAPFFQDA
jgi:SSS family solute:Na+ symporter/sodium/proline symporter